MIAANPGEAREPSSTGPASGAGAKCQVRRPIAVLLSRFPLITETFILREVIELERQGQPVRLVPLIRERPDVTHREARPWVDRALYTPYLSTAIVRSNLKRLRQRPAVYWGLLRKLFLGRGQRLGVRVRNLALFPKAVYLAERLQAEGIQHVHAHFATYPASVAFVISSLTDISYSVTVHAHDIFVGHELLEEKLSAASWIRAISEFNRRYLLGLYPNLPAESLKVIHVGVERPSETSEDEMPDTDSRAPLILAIAALKPYKGLSVLLEACRILRDEGASFRCDIIGRGPLRDRLQDMIDDLGLSDRVSLLGAQPQHEVARAITAASVVVQPSIVAPDGQMEGIPVALMEALTAGRPVVASALSGIPELIEHGVGGMLTTPGDARDVAAAIGSLIADPEAARRLGSRGRRRVRQEFDLTSTVRQMRVQLDGCNPALEEDPQLPSHVLGELVPTARRAGLRRVQRGRDSTVFELMVAGDGGPEEIVLKAHRSFAGESRPARVRATDEYRRLHRIHHFLEQVQQSEPQGDVGLRVPRPTGLLESSAALSMERCRGASLLETLRDFRGSSAVERTDDMAAVVRRVGEWLRTFQRLAVESRGGVEPEQHLNRITRTALTGIEDCLPPAKASACREHAAALLARLEPIRPVLVARHGDFWPGNIFVSGSRTEVIDFEGLDTGLRYEDVCDFVAHLEMLFAYPHVRRQGRALIRAFLEGFLGGAELDQSLYRLCRSMAVLRLVHSHSERHRVGLMAAWRRHHLLTLVPNP